MKSQKELETLLSLAKSKVNTAKHDLNNAIQNARMTRDLIDLCYPGWTLLDKCEVCHGTKGGLPGNENHVNGLIMCDYCHAEDMYRRNISALPPQRPSDEEAKTLIERLLVLYHKGSIPVARIYEILDGTR